MGKKLTTYFDFAEDDYQYLLEDYNNGRVANYMGASAQNTCERYLKYIIEEMYKAHNDDEIDEKAAILKVHNLKKLMKFLREYELCDITKEEYVSISAINGFYFSTRYPGDESISIDKEDLDNCMIALEICRNKALELIMQKYQTEQQENEIDDDMGR